jgi:DNA recombination protein RmuC
MTLFASMVFASLAFIVGLATAYVLSLKATSSIREAHDTARSELSASLAEKTTALAVAQDSVHKAGEERARAIASVTHLEVRVRELTGERDIARSATDTAKLQIADMQREVEVAQARISEERRSLTTQQAQLIKNRVELTQAFNLAAKQLFQDESAAFRQMNTEEVTKVLEPFRQQLAALQAGVVEASKERHTLQNHIERIALEANSLTQALKGDPKAQGDWGEMVLETILQNSGLEKNVSYFIQPTYKDMDGNNVRLDVVIKLPDERYMIVDSKVTITDYERYYAAENSEDRSKHLNALVASIKAHIASLASKRYDRIPELPTLEAVMMWVPLEAAMNAAILKDRSIVEFAHQRRVIPVTATTMFAVIKVVERLWQYERQVSSVQDIVDRATKLYDKFVGVTEAFDNLRDSLKAASNSYETARNRLLDGHGSVARQVELMRERGGLPTKKQLSGSWKEGETESPVRRIDQDND